MLIFTYPYNKWWIIFINVIVVVITLYFVAKCPRYWVVTNDGLRLKRFFGPSLFFPFRRIYHKALLCLISPILLGYLGQVALWGLLDFFIQKNWAFFFVYHR